MSTEPHWIPVNANSDVPDGLWHVRTKHGDSHVFDNGATSPKSRTVGHYFEFDEEVTMYWSEALAPPPQPEKKA
jgi:hypothetical protein